MNNIQDAAKLEVCVSALYRNSDLDSFVKSGQSGFHSHFLKKMLNLTIGLTCVSLTGWKEH